MYSLGCVEEWNENAVLLTADREMSQDLVNAIEKFEKFD